MKSDTESRIESRLLDRDVQLKVWVPESVYTAMTLLADEESISRADWVRYALVAHVYGRPTLERAKRDPDRYFEPMFSRRAREPGEASLPLGKSTVDSKVRIARDLHETLAVLAHDAGDPLGRYASRVLCWAAFGHGFFLRSAASLTAGYLIGDGKDTPAMEDAAS